MKIDMTFCPPLRLKMKVKRQQVISRRKLLPGKPLYPTEKNLQGLLVVIRPRLEYQITIRPQGGHTTGTMAHIVTVYFTRRQECPSASTCHIVLRIELECVPIILSRTEWVDPLGIGTTLCSSIRNP